MRWELVGDADRRNTWSRIFRECMPYDDEPPGYHTRWLGYSGDKAVAVLSAAILLPAEPCVYLSIIAVCESARGKRIQRRAIRHVERWALEHDCLAVISYTHSQNCASMTSFIRCGYMPYLPQVAWAGRDPHWVYWRRILTPAS